MLFFALLFASVSLACDPTPEPVKDLDVNTFYSDSKGSIPDEKLLARHDAIMAPIETYMKGLAKFADKKNAASADCALTWLQDWAHAGAFLGEMKTEQAFYERKWMLGGIGLVYARIRASGAQDSDVEAWLKKLAKLTIEHSDAHKGKKNNHYYSEGLAVTVVGAILGDKTFLAWGQKVFEAGMNDIQPDGTLPYELDRGTRALHYHAAAAAPLAFMASILDQSSPKLTLLVNFIFSSIQDPGPLESRLKVKIEIPKSYGLAWSEVFLRREKNSAVEKYLEKNRPLGFSKLGGTLTTPNPLEHPVKN